MDKIALRQAILSQLEAELALLTDAANTSRDEATNEESRSEDKYDMRSQSAAYLAIGQAKLASEIADAIAAYRNLTLREFAVGEPVAVGAVVTLTARLGGRRTIYFLGPQHGGLEVKVGSAVVTVITAASPVGRLLLGRWVGDQLTVAARPKPVEHTLTAVT